MLQPILQVIESAAPIKRCLFFFFFLSKRLNCNIVNFMFIFLVNFSHYTCKILLQQDWWKNYPSLKRISAQRNARAILTTIYFRICSYFMLSSESPCGYSPTCIHVAFAMNISVKRFAPMPLAC